MTDLTKDKQRIKAQLETSERLRNSSNNRERLGSRSRSRSRSPSRLTDSSGRFEENIPVEPNSFDKAKKKDSFKILELDYNIDLTKSNIRNQNLEFDYHANAVAKVSQGTNAIQQTFKKKEVNNDQKEPEPINVFIFFVYISF